MKHSPEPWEADHKETHSREGEECHAVLRDADDRTICDTLNSDVRTVVREDDEDGARYRDEPGFADLERAAACVNAMAGAADPAAFVKDLRVRLAAAERQRDGLLAAAKAMLDCRAAATHMPGGSMEAWGAAFMRLVAAIAAAETKED